MGASKYMAMMAKAITIGGETGACSAPPACSRTRPERARALPRSDTQHRRNQPGSSAPKGDCSVRLDPGHDLRPGVYYQVHTLLCRSLCQPHTRTHAHAHTHTHSFLSVRLTAATAECRVDTWTLPAGKLDAHEISHPLRVGAFVKHARARAHTERPAVVVVATSRAVHSRGSPLACSFGQAWSLCESYSLALITCAIYYGAALVDKEPFDP
eukprot:COSAG03_NODE_553_length_6971_cov_3.971624_1_plen_212_part_00